MEPEDGCDVLCLVLHLPFDGLKHDVREVDTDDVEAIAGELIHLRPHEAASCARLVLNDGVDRRTVLLQHNLLVTSGYIRLASSRKRLPIQDIPVRAGLRKNCGRHDHAQQCYHLLHGSTRPRAKVCGSRPAGTRSPDGERRLYSRYPVRKAVPDTRRRSDLSRSVRITRCVADSKYSGSDLMVWGANAALGLHLFVMVSLVVLHAPWRRRGRLECVARRCCMSLRETERVQA